jgi:hypothetical protein
LKVLALFEFQSASVSVARFFEILLGSDAVDAAGDTIGARYGGRSDDGVVAGKRRSARQGCYQTHRENEPRTKHSLDFTSPSA